MSDKWKAFRALILEQAKGAGSFCTIDEVLELLDERDSLQEQLYDALKQLDAEKLGEKVVTIKRQQRAIEVWREALKQINSYRDACLDYQDIDGLAAEALDQGERILKGEEQ